MSAQLKPAEQPARYFKILADGTKVSADDPRTDHVAVLDTRLGLEFYVHSIGINGKAASDVRDLKPIVEKLDVLGGGWRWPDDEEAASIIRRDRYNPAVDTNLFPGIKPAWHITSKEAAWAPASAAWWVCFYYGLVFDFYLGGGGFALAVRPAGQ